MVIHVNLGSILCYITDARELSIVSAFMISKYFRMFNVTSVSRFC